MNTLIRTVMFVLILSSFTVQAESGNPFVSITASPFAAMSADNNRYEVAPADTQKFNMNLHQGYGLRLSAWNMYGSITQAMTDRDAEIPNGRFTAISAGFLVDEMDEISYPIGLYTRFGAGLGSAKLHYAQSDQSEQDLLWEFFAESGVTFAHYYQLGLQGKMQGLFKVGDTRALLGEVAVVASVHF